MTNNIDNYDLESPLDADSNTTDEVAAEVAEPAPTVIQPHPLPDGIWIGVKGDREKALEKANAACFYRKFSLKPENTDGFNVPVTSAELIIACPGLYDAKINGLPLDDSVLNPPNTQFEKTVLCRKYDVKELIREGENELYIEIGNGFYNESVGVWNWQKAAWRDTPRLLCELRVTFEDGVAEGVATDDGWVATYEGPTGFNSIYYGEDYDARNVPPQNWQSAVAVTAPEGELIMQTVEPMRRTASFAPFSVEAIGDGSYLVTAPEMITGWAKITFRGVAQGDNIRIGYAEKRDVTGIVRIGANLPDEPACALSDWFPLRYIQTDHYTCSADEAQTFEPKFSYKGFLYIQVDGYRGVLNPEDITLYRVANNVKATGEFACSNAALDNLHAMFRRTVFNNLQGKLTDTPVYEKNGWLGDLNVAYESIAYNLDAKETVKLMMRTMRDAFSVYGVVPIMVPTANWGIADWPTWNSAFVFGADILDRYYGEDEFVREYFPVLREYINAHVNKIAASGFISPDGELADWVSPLRDENAVGEEMPSEGSKIVSTAFVYKALEVMQRLAEKFESPEDAQLYYAARTQIKAAFNTAFYNAETGIYDTGTFDAKYNRTPYRQTSNLVAVAFGLAEKSEIKKIVKNIADDVASKDYHPDTGCVGTKFILPVLSDNGYIDVAYKIITQNTYPSWGYWVEKGATTLWEMWESTARSHDHYFLGTYEEWLFSHLGGIRNIKDGYASFDVNPLFPAGLDTVNVKLDTPNGEVALSWKRLEKDIDISVTVPSGSAATLAMYGKRQPLPSGKTSRFRIRF